MNPTSTVSPARAVGARRLPVGPSIAFTASSDDRLSPENSLTFLPFAAIRRDAPASRAAASLA